MAGGTFTISNGGVYGSMLSTPIINPPQSAILGMHAITPRATVVGREILPRPIMNVALTYDHRLIDGREVRYLLVPDGLLDCMRLWPSQWRSRKQKQMERLHMTASALLQIFGVMMDQTEAEVNFTSAQAVTFLKRLKEVIEDPRRMLLGV